MGKPKVFEYRLTVKPSDLDELNHVNNVVYFEYLQKAAIEHWNKVAALEDRERVRWVVRKHEIEYFKSAFAQDELTVFTWIRNFSQITSERHYEIKRGEEVLVRASTLWVALNPETMKPQRVRKEVTEAFFEK